MPQGRIKTLLGKQGFGVIEGEQGNDLIFHHSALKGIAFNELSEGQLVEFEVGQGPKGPSANSVQLPISTQ